MAYIRRIRAYCETLASFPERGRRRDDLRRGLWVIGFERRVVIAYMITPFIEWQGRYPIPTKDTDYVAGYSLNTPDEHKFEHALWDRLRDYLALVGWHQDIDGNRYKLKLEGAKVSIDSQISAP